MDEAKEPEDRLEQLAREAADNARFEFNPGAWEAMEKKLDTPNRKPFVWWKWLLPLLLLGSLAVFLLKPNTENQQPTVNQKGESSSIDSTQNKPNSVESDSKSTEKNQVAENVQKEGAFNSDNDLPKNESSALANVDRRVNPDEARNNSLNNLVPTEDSELDSFISRTNDLQPAPIIWLAFVEMPEGSPQMVLPQLILYKEDEIDSVKSPKWAVSVFASADFSTTRLDGFSKPGTMAGIGLEYYFNERWSFQTGAVFSVKKYTALGSEYQNPSWATYYDITNINATCKVVDIPLNVRRYFATQSGDNFFASTGISSYLMLSEDYDYQYEGYHPNWPDHYGVKNQNQHYLGVLNLSVGYERMLTSHLILGLEPFAKVPLAGVGVGKVKLLSFGANLSLKLRH